MRFSSIGKDHLGALICVLLGAGVLALGLTYGVGTLREMGAGFIPVAIGALLIVVGAAIGITAVTGSDEPRFVDMHRGKTKVAPEWRAWVCIVGGIAAFVVLGAWCGLVPATFLSVFISALGDRKNTLRSAAALAAIITVFAAVVFHFLLNLSLPLFRWG